MIMILISEYICIKGNIQKNKHVNFVASDTKRAGGVRAEKQKTRRVFKKVFFSKTI